MTSEHDASDGTRSAPSPELESAGAPVAEGDRAEPAQDSRENRVRRAAYARYEQRGKEGGHEVEDWLNAEAEVTASENDAEGQPAPSR